MHMKYYQPLADIMWHLEKILDICENPGSFEWEMLQEWGVKKGDIENIREEREVCRYLVSCQLMLAYGRSVHKPSLEAVDRCFKRHLAFLEKQNGIHAHNVNEHVSKSLKKQYQACRHYLFKFSLPAWYEKMPDKILTFEEKYNQSL